MTEPLEADDLLALLNARAPRGMTFIRAEVLDAKASPQPTRVDYDASVDEPMLATVAKRAEAFNRAETWPVERRPNKPRGAGKARELDLKTFVRDLGVREGHLRFSLVTDGQRWARPGEVLDAVGLDGRVDTSRLVRTNLLCDF